MNFTALTKRTILWCTLCSIFFVSLVLSFFRTDAAYADVRRYYWITIPTWPPKEEITQNVDNLCAASNSDIGRYSDSAINSFIDKCKNTDAAILFYHNSFGQKELDAIRRRLAGCQSAFAKEQQKRQVRFRRGLREDKTPSHAK